MKLKLGHTLIAINILTWILIIIIHLSSINVLRIMLGIPFLLFSPGYTLNAALFTQKDRISGIERVVLSIALSIAIVPLIGLIINYTPWGITLEPIMYSVASFILLCSVVAWLRQRKLPKDEQIVTKFSIIMPIWGKSVSEKILTVIFVIVCLGVMAAIGYFITVPKVGETFTEFYLLGQQGDTMNYPDNLIVGETGTMIVGITNHEGTETSYRVEVVIGGDKRYDVGPIVLADEENWESKLVFIPEVAGNNQKIEFVLYNNNEVEPSLESLYIWIDVDEQQ